MYVLQVFIVGFIVSICRKRRSFIEHMVDRDDQFNDSDDELLIQP